MATLDDFNRTVASGWGTMSSGWAWSQVTLTNATTSVDGTHGVLAGLSGGFWIDERSTGAGPWTVAAGFTETTHLILPTQTPALWSFYRTVEGNGEGLICSLYAPGGGIFRLEVGDKTNGTNVVELGAASYGVGGTVKWTWDPATRVLSGKFWLDSAAEPAAWQVTYTAPAFSLGAAASQFYQVNWSSGGGPFTVYVDSIDFVTLPEPGIFVDWGLDGFGEPGTIDEIAGDVQSVSWRRGASYDHVSSPGPGSATIIVDNSDGKYNPDNAAGDLYGKLLPKRPVWCGALRDTGAVTGTGTVRGFFAGRITEIAPVPIPGGSGTAEIICEDAQGSYRRASASVAPSQTRSYGDFRTAILDFIGESSARRSLEAETDMMPFSAADTRQALGLLEELNTATGSRHFIAPADSKEDWYDYTVVNRLHKLASAADEAVNADDISAISGYRVTGDTILNEQRASVNPIDFSSANEIVWTYAQVPLTVTSAAPLTLWAEFADYVFSAAVVANSSGGTLTPTLTSFGTTAKLVLTVTGAAVTIASLTITGQALRRGDAQTIVSSTTLTSASQTSYGILAGSDIATDLIGQTGHAQGVVDFITWKFREPLKRPSITIAGKSAATLNSILDRDLFDVITLTADRLNVAARRFEIIGISGTLVPGLFWEVRWELQETPNQAVTTFFTWDTSSWDGGSLWAPF